MKKAATTTYMGIPTAPGQGGPVTVLVDGAEAEDAQVLYRFGWRALRREKFRREANEHSRA